MTVTLDDVLKAKDKLPSRLKIRTRTTGAPLMTATYTWDVFSSLDGYGSNTGDWGGYWGKQGPELLSHRLKLYSVPQRMVFGANTYRAFAKMRAPGNEGSDAFDPWVTKMTELPLTVITRHSTDRQPRQCPSAGARGARG